MSACTLASAGSFGLAEPAEPPPPPELILTIVPTIATPDASSTIDEPPHTRAIFEVLSDSTEDYDRGTKFKNYRSIPSLRDYVLVAQHEILVEHFVRQADGSWLLRERRQGELLELVSIGCAIPVDELYLKVFPPARPAEP